jgi:hypothetical protein
MLKYTVVLEEVGGVTSGYQHYFTCVADDNAHAVEQATNAYPTDFVVGVYIGEPQSSLVSTITNIGEYGE